MLGVVGFDQKVPLGWQEMMILIGIEILVIVPPLYALQRAVALVSSLTISILTALGLFVIFALQIVEGRVDYSTATLIGLAVFSAGSLAAA